MCQETLVSVTLGASTKMNICSLVKIVLNLGEGHTSRARHPGMQSQVGLRKHHNEKASGGDGIPVELSQILKDDAVKVQHSICQQIWKLQQWPQDWKSSVFISIPKKGNDKEYSNNHTIGLMSHASKVMLKILQARLQQYVNHELPVVQAGFRKGRGTRNEIANIRWIIEKGREFQKNILLLYRLCPNL